MAENKTRPTQQSVQPFIKSIDDEQKRADSMAVMKMKQQITTEKPKMWGQSIVGFGGEDS